MPGRDWLIVGLIAVAVSASVGRIAVERLDGLSIDLLFWLRQEVFGTRQNPADSPAVVVAIDEETYRTPPFADRPTALWTPQLAAVLGAVIAGDAKVTGLDVILATSVESALPGFDRDYLIALQSAARANKVVLAKVQHQQLPISPFRAQSLVVDGAKNVRAANLFRDNDEVIRRVPLTFQSENADGGLRTENALAVELAARAAGRQPTRLADGAMAFGDYRVPNSQANAMLLNFGPGDAIPTYSFADLYFCAQAGRSDFFKRHFAGKVVLIGTVLDVGDRKLTSNRFISGPRPGQQAARCVMPPSQGFYRTDFVPAEIPGVYVQATAVNNLLRRDALRTTDPLVESAIITALGVLVALAAMALPPIFAGAALAAGIVLWTAAAIAAFNQELALPLLAPMPTAVLVFAISVGFRFTVTDRNRRHILDGLQRYLHPSVIAQLMQSGQLPELGGEVRTTTVLFCDIENFTTLAEHLPPAELVAKMNEYLAAMTDAVEAEGGFVDKYLGDGLSAVFGAPVPHADHAARGVRAALACRDKLADLNRTVRFSGVDRIRARIGLNAGATHIGNIGSPRRFNYTVMGDTVNLASRLENLNKVYGTDILASETVHAAAALAIDWREVDRVRVKGRDTPVTIYEPVAQAGQTEPVRRATIAEFAAALREYRAGDFAAALARFAAIAAVDKPAEAFVQRLQGLPASPPSMPWDGITNLEEK